MKIFSLKKKKKEERMELYVIHFSLLIYINIYIYIMSSKYINPLFGEGEFPLLLF